MWFMPTDSRLADECKRFGGVVAAADGAVPSLMA